MAALAALDAPAEIAAPPDGPAAAVAQEAMQLLRAAGRAGHGAFRQSSSGGPAVAIRDRPLVVVLDRGADLAAALRHPVTLCGLLGETVGTVGQAGTRVRAMVDVQRPDGEGDEKGKTAAGGSTGFGSLLAGFVGGSGGATGSEGAGGGSGGGAGGGDMVQVDLDAGDAFWQRAASLEWVSAVDAHKRAVEGVAIQEAKVRRSGEGQAVGGAGASSGTGEGGESGDTGLHDALSSLPAVLRNKEHLARMGKLLRAVDRRMGLRSLDRFFLLGQDSVAGPGAGTMDADEVIKVIAGEAAATDGDEGGPDGSLHSGADAGKESATGAGALADRARLACVFIATTTTEAAQAIVDKVAGS